MKLPATLSHDALGTRFYLEIFDEISPVQIETIIREVTLFLSQFEKRYSRFLFDSVVGTLNRERIIPNPNQEFLALLKFGHSLTMRTNGLFNMLVGGALEHRGYDSTYSFIPNEANESKYPNPLTDIVMSPIAVIIQNGNLDLGGFGKGYAIDLLAAHLQKTFNLKYFLINGGGDMYATSNHGKPFIIYLEHPLKINTYLGTTEILNQGFAGSSPHKRSWVHNGSTYTHIVNTQPHPSPQKLHDASFIIARNCVEADAFATIALMVNDQELTHLAIENELAFATFTAPTTLISNQAFTVQNL